MNEWWNKRVRVRTVGVTTLFNTFAALDEETNGSEIRRIGFNWTSDLKLLWIRLRVTATCKHPEPLKAQRHKLRKTIRATKK